jgi:adenylate cyclase
LFDIEKFDLLFRHVTVMNTQRATTASPTMPRVRVPIRAKITIPYLVLSLSLAIAATYLITQLVVENVEERFNRQLFEAGKISSELIVSYESQLLETERLIANLEGFPAAIVANDADEMRDLILGIVANDQQEAVEIFDRNGNHVLSIHHRPGGNPEEYEFSTGGQSSLSELEIVKNVVGGEQDAKGDKFADFVRTDSGDRLYVAGPIYDSSRQLVGAVLVGRSVSLLAADMRMRTFAQITFYDQSGQVVYSTLPYPTRLTAEVVANTISFKDIKSGRRNLANERNLDVANIPYTEIIGSWEVRGDHELGVLGVALSQNAVVQASSESRWRIFLLVATANFLSIRMW